MSLYLLKIAFASFRNRKLSVILSVMAIAISLALFLSIEMVRKGIRQSFNNTISQTDLIVGARTGATDLLLFSVFHLGSPTNNISYYSFQYFKQKENTRWAIPISIGDSHDGYRVVGTDSSFFTNFRFYVDKSIELSQGKIFEGVFDVVLGSEVAQQLQYKLGQSIALNHGLDKHAVLDHADKPFTVSGILKKTYTPIDRSLYVSLNGIEAMHADWFAGVPPTEEDELSPEQVKEKLLTGGLRVEKISAFFLALKSRMTVLQLQREVALYKKEAIMAVIPALELQKLYLNMNYAENALKLISAIVIVVSLISMLIAIYSSLQQRRREMAILRAMGTRPSQIFFLFLSESMLLSTLGSVLGVAMLYLLLFILQSIIASTTGFYLPISALHKSEIFFILSLIAMAFIIGLIPAIQAYRNTLTDGLTIRL